ncbi:hypothetical protein ACQJBY_046611 [Aegilops geniculata]
MGSESIMQSSDQTAAIVDEKFHAPTKTAFTVTKCFTSKGAGFTVTDFSGVAAVMEVETTEVGVRNLSCLLCRDAASPSPLITLQEAMISSMGQRQWKAFRGHGTNGSDLLFVAVDMTRFFQMGITLHVFRAGNTPRDEKPDFVVRGSYYRGAMTVSHRNEKDNYIDIADIAEISRESSLWCAMLGHNTYTVSISQGVDQAFVLALTVILDQTYSPKLDSCCCACDHSSPYGRDCRRRQNRSIDM